ncbi:3-oxo-5-alpha-steroid 4-dehydrogenase family protein [Babesia bovis T2Bo]|uniref:3-oxo-5-alpha-steroid 4-dehydrogenase family protein n=1 Tax=Babesia bovis T2Bo TaxID=484906 RepID=UPI001C35A27A|nr:3-oxo-5-alpha-steroid 4-dehydrogenase family protein [Babesia bovis T2Bo]KAG6440153.1 3-oxo-5-alpha-steroid 4-dehydrogenase family protein [Babesia bovis T2Bo]
MVYYLDLLVNLFFLLGAFFCILSCDNPFVYRWSVHGKQVALLSAEDSKRYNPFRVSKQLFIHFYIWGLFINAILFFLELSLWNLFNPFRALFGVHLIRRYLEQKYLFNVLPSSSMHFTAYIFGACYYFFVPIALCHPDYHISALHVAAFIVSQYMQFKSHYILHTTKRGSRRFGEVTYGVPTGGLFNYILCPHYCSEVIVYLSLLCNVEMFSCFFFVSTAMIVQALSHRKWYIAAFLPSELHTVYSIVPYVI